MEFTLQTAPIYLLACSKKFESRHTKNLYEIGFSMYVTEKQFPKIQNGNFVGI